MKIVAGFDLSSESVAYCVMNGHGEVVQRAKMGWTPSAWRDVLAPYCGDDLVVVYEAAPEAYRAKALLDKLNFASHIFHPAHFPGISRSKRKTDRIDAKKMAQAAVAGTLPRAIHLPTGAQAHIRYLVVEYVYHQRQQVRARCRTRCQARMVGVPLRKSRSGYDADWWDAAMEAFPAIYRSRVARCRCMVLLADQAMDQISDELDQHIKQGGYGAEVKRLMTVPGVGRQVAITFVAYVGDGSTFGSGRKLGSYTGMAPSISQTGKQQVQLGKVTKEGPSVLRWMFLQAAHSAVRSKKFRETYLYTWYLDLRARRGKKRAKVALARRLAGICLAIVRDKTTFDVERLRPVDSHHAE